MLYLAIFAQRLAEAVVSGLPYVLTGLLLAAAVSVYVPVGRLRRWVATRDDGRSDNALLSPLVGAVWGMVLPVCSVGAIPLLLVARRAGVSRRGLAGFAVTSGFVNPYTLIYAMGLTSPWKVLLLAVCGAAVGALAGWAVGERAPRTFEAPEPVGRLVALPFVAGKILLGTLAVYFALTALVAAGVATAIPPGFIGHLFTESDAVHVLLTAAIALPAYPPPAIAALQTTEILWQRTDPGAALLWWMLGAGMSAGKLLFLPRVLGWGGTVRVAAAAVVLAVGLAFAISPALRDAPVPDDDSHAFDRHNQPYHHAVEQHGSKVWLGKKLGELSTPDAHIAAMILLLLTLTVATPPGWAAAALSPRPASARGALPGWAITSAALVGGGAVLLSLLYTHYPDPASTFTAIRHPDAELSSVLRSGKWEATFDPLRSLEAQVGLLGPGALLRSPRLPATFGGHLNVARSHMASLRTAVNMKDGEKASAESMSLTRALRDAEKAWATR